MRSSFLVRGEEFIFQSRPHVVEFLPAGLLFLLVIFALTTTVSSMVAAVIAMIGAVFLLVALHRVYANEFIITNRRLVSQSGWVFIESAEIFLNKVEDIKIKRGLIGIAFGYSTISVTGTGGSIMVLDKVSNPKEFKAKLDEQIFKEVP
jgi:membrane protein YdbS with pleckstrin-like domain